MKHIIISVYRSVMSVLQVVAPELWAKISYRRTYGKKCDLRHPSSFSEKLLWLWLHDYRNNRTIMEMNDKYDVRKYIERAGLGHLLNELYFVTDDPQTIRYEDLPQSFALKLSQGWNTNLICPDKSSLPTEKLYADLKKWSKGQFFYDLGAAKIGGIKVRELPKHYICEKYLGSPSEPMPSDYKIYCFHGRPTAILYISDRGAEKKGCFLRPDWSYLGSLNEKTYQKMDQLPPRPACLEEMIRAAESISKPFPFVRVDLYVSDGRPVFGETTFFPSGCIGMQETEIDGIPMADLLHIQEQ